MDYRVPAYQDENRDVVFSDSLEAMALCNHDHCVHVGDDHYNSAYICQSCGEIFIDEEITGPYEEAQF